MGASPRAENERAIAATVHDAIDRARRGDPEALKTIYDEHAQAVMRRLTHATGDPELARDLTQDAFVTAFSRLDRFRGDSSLSTWLHAIAFNHLRDRRKRARRERSLWDRLRRRPALTAAPPEQALITREDLARLQAALAQLDDDKRDAFVLRVVEQLSLEEASAILGASVATISYRAKTAEKLLREQFEEGQQS